MNRLTDGIREDLMRKRFDWMEGTYKFLFLDERYTLEPEHKTIYDIPHAYIVGESPVFRPTGAKDGKAMSIGVMPTQLVDERAVHYLALVEAHNEDVEKDRFVAFIDEGFDLPFVPEGQEIYVLPSALYGNAWFVV